MKSGFLLNLGLMGVLGCSQAMRPPEYGPKQPEAQQQASARWEILVYTGATEEYTITAQEETKYGLCTKRTIILKENPAGLNNHPFHVEYVRGWDTGCNASIDNWQFRGPNVMTEYLEKYLLYAFEVAKLNYVWENRPKNKTAQ